MRFFREVEVAKVCYLTEVVEWIVRGLVPQAHYTDDGQEVRGNLYALQNEYSIASDPLTPEELEHFGSTMSFDEYIDALYGPSMDHIDWSRRISSNGEENKFEFADDVIAQLDQAREEAQKAEQERRAYLEAELADYFDEVERAKAGVISAVVSGKLAVYGSWVADDEEFFEKSVKEHPVVAEEIPPREITPSRLDWKNNTLRPRRGGVYLEVFAKTSDMLSLFPPRHGEQKRMNVFNGNAVSTDTGDTQPSMSHNKRPRGRPQKAAGAKEFLRAWYVKQRLDGKVGFKQDSDISAATAFLRESIGKEYVRSTIQEYLADLLPSRKPENASK